MIIADDERRDGRGDDKLQKFLNPLISRVCVSRCLNNAFLFYLSLLLEMLSLSFDSLDRNDEMTKVSRAYIRTSASVQIVNCNPHRIIWSVIFELARIYLQDLQTRMMSNALH